MFSKRLCCLAAWLPELTVTNLSRFYPTHSLTSTMLLSPLYNSTHLCAVFRIVNIADSQKDDGKVCWEDNDICRDSESEVSSSHQEEIIEEKKLRLQTHAKLCY